ncbi:MAG: cytochrome c oxidase subunit II [Gaiellaceae bacterium]
MRRGSIVQLVAMGAIAGGIAVVVALFVPWLPKPAAREAGRIDFVFWFVTGICLFIFTIVASVIGYAVLKFRVQPDDDSDGPAIHGHTGLEVAWTAVPAVLVTAIAIVSGIVLAKNDASASNELRVKVVARQFAWSFQYPQYNNLTSGQLRLPLNRPVRLQITSMDVTHAFWVPQFGQNLDAVPGAVNNLRITPNRLGTFPVICNELCGLGHALMRSEAIVMKPAAFTAWASGGKTLGGAISGAKVFADNGCGACHTLKAAGSTATVGPNLDKLPAEARQAGQPLEAFIRESIVKPNAYIQAGYPPNVMPQTFGQLPSAQLDALVQYLITSSKGKP